MRLIIDQLNQEIMVDWFLLIICDIFLTGIDLKKINQCMGDPDADEENAVLKAEQDAQVKALHCLFLIDLAICLHSHNTVLYLMPILRLERIPVAMLLFYRLLLLIIGNIEVSFLSNHVVRHVVS